MHLLCLSNGHGEDEIAVRILQALQQQSQPPEIAALPIVGEGHAYTRAGIPVIGTVKTMPSGGFIYMDSRQLARDIRGGLLQLTLAQIQAVRSWANEHGTTSVRSQKSSDRAASESVLILSVGDIVPLLFAWLSGIPYAFVGTAKSEYYIRDESGMLPRQSWWSDRLERWTGCIYHPWERWLMSRPNCKAVFPRDGITTKILQRYGVPAVDLGNPMMDGLAWQPTASDTTMPDHELFASPGHSGLSLIIALLPGSRPPEAYANWEVILQAINGLIAQTERPLMLLAAIAPTLEEQILHQSLIKYRWQAINDMTYVVGVGAKQATLIMAENRFAEFLHRADLAIAMAGTATEQFIGLGKPAVIIPGDGPQFTPAFAEAQTRLLGTSVTLATVSQVAPAIQALLQNPDRLQLIAANGTRRMGEPGAARRIAQHLLTL